MRVREARPGEHAAVMGVLDAAMLDTDAASVRERIPRDVLVAVVGDGDERASRVVGALVLAGDEIEAVAVRPGRRGQGVGTALVEAAARRRDRLTAAFDADLRPFYEELGFEVEPVPDEEGRLRGER